MDVIERNQDYFSSLAKVESIHLYNTELEESATATAVVNGIELLIPLAELIDIDKEKARLDKEIKRLQGLEKGISAKLKNENFVKRAPELVVKSEKEKLSNIQGSLIKLKENYEKLV
jgi:valyl-tRNA synthetase